MDIILTIHATEKLKTKEAKSLGIDKRKIISTVKQPITTDKTLNPYRSIGKLTDMLSLAVIWKKEGGIIKIITFYPAEKGRYESKILRRR